MQLELGLGIRIKAAYQFFNQHGRRCMKAKIVEYLETHDDATNKELARYLGTDACSVTGRIMELRIAGAVQSSQVRMCAVTGNKVLAWRLAWI